MGLYGMMRTGVSGMAAQANRLATVADNIANSNTTGYKRAYTEFSSLIIPGTQGNYNSGGVKTSVRYAISQQGPLQFTASSNDLAINGNGFFVVKDASGSPFLARAGTFVPDGQGRLVNAAGFYLTGYNYENGNPAVVANGFDGLEIISIADSELSAEVTTEGVFSANLPADAEIGDTEKSSLVVYDYMGRKKIINLEYTKTAADEWRLDIVDEDDNVIGTATLEFDAVTGRLSAASDSEIQFDIPGTAPAANVTIDLAGMSQLATGYNVSTSTVNGSAPSQIQEVKISGNGVVSALYKNGAEKPLFRIPLAAVQSPDQLAVLPGNVYTQSPDSGDIKIGFPETGQFGSVVSGALEGSNVDIASELTNMIESQRNYTANSKIFQTGSDLLDVLVNLKR